MMMEPWESVVVDDGYQRVQREFVKLDERRERKGKRG